MKVKTSITLSKGLWQDLGPLAKAYGNRSVVIEEALKFFIKEMKKRQCEKGDLKILNRKAQRLNQEAAEVLTYQADL